MTAAVTAPTSVVSVGDDGALNATLKPSLAGIWIDRDLSWLDFNQRVLAEALDERTPLLERAKFLAIFTSNLDEFFMKRIAVLRESLPPDRAGFLSQLNGKLLPVLETQARCFNEQIVPALASHSVYLRHWEDLTSGQRSEATPLTITPLTILPPMHADMAMPCLSKCISRDGQYVSRLPLNQKIRRVCTQTGIYREATRKTSNWRFVRS